jgi:hypothetical protein
MSDDELIERLRRTLQNEAAAITPGPPGERPAAYPAAGLPPRSRGRARWPLAVAAAVAAAVGLSLAFWPGGGSTHIGIVAPGPSTGGATTPSTAVPTTRATAASVAPTVPSTVAPAATVSPGAASSTPPTVPPAAEVPAGFAPLSVTFVSADQGWVAGAAPCGSRSCLTLARTVDGGRTWDPAPAPPVTVTNEADGGLAGLGVSVRFGNASDGWVYTRQPASLWSTHDGGASWHPVASPALTAGTTIMAMEVSAGRVQVAVVLGNSSTVHLETSPLATDRFVDNDTGVTVGAGPVPATQLVLQRSQGWLLENDRTVVAGSRLNGTASWTTWTPPCRTANGPAALAASTPDDLVAVCLEGEWGPARNLPAGSRTPSSWLFRSSDGGTGFEPVGPLPDNTEAAMVATPAPSTVVVGGAASDLSASFDGGHSWHTVYRGVQVQDWSYLGFTTLTQGVAIGSGASGASLLAMTRDGGHSWTAVSFRTAG